MTKSALAETQDCLRHYLRQRDMLLAAANDLSQAYGPDADYADDIGGQRTRAWNALHRAIAECEGKS